MRGLPVVKINFLKNEYKRERGNELLDFGYFFRPNQARAHDQNLEQDLLRFHKMDFLKGLVISLHVTPQKFSLNKTTEWRFEQVISEISHLFFPGYQFSNPIQGNSKI
jgi:hypothetical protein